MSTKQVDRSKALAEALELERAAKLAGRGELVEAKAREIVKGILERSGCGDTIRSPSVRSFFVSWMSSKDATKSARTSERYAQIVDRFLAFIDKRADKPLTSLAPEDVERFLNSRLKAGLANRTCLLDIKILRTALNAARRKGLITTNPAEAVELPKAEGVERGTFSAAEVAILVVNAKAEWKTLILLAYFTGARLGDCCGLTWDNVDLTAGTLEYASQKSGAKVKIPLHPDLAAHLEELASTDSTGKPIMPHMSTLKPGGRHGLSEGFKRLLRASGIDCQTVEGSGVRRVSKRPFHALRHSFTSALMNAGVPEELRMKLTGHKSKAVHTGYSHAELQTLRGAVDKLPSLSAGGAR